MIGWIGAVAFGICGLPQAVKTYRDGNADGLDITFLILWTVGELCTLYAVIVDSPRPYLIANYLANLIFLLIMWRYKIWPRK